MPAACALLIAGLAGSRAAPAATAAPDEIAALKAELEALKADTAAREAALEARIRQLEAASATAGGTAAPSVAAAPPPAPAPAYPEPAPPAPVSARGSSNPTAFNPAISMIITGNYAALSEDPNTYRVAGFIPPPEGEGPGPRSFNLGESELTVASNVDPYFFAQVTAAIQGDNSIDIEEAFFKTIALSHGFTVKGGRFFSGTGYLNEIHSHNWDFADQPLVYQVFFGGQLAQDGMQVRWVAPTDYFLEFGGELGSGRSFPATQRNSNALASDALFVHVGNDIGDSTSWRLGVSWLDQRATDRAYADVDEFGAPVTNAFTGTSRTWIVDGTLKWAPHGDPTQHQLKLQGEYMHRTESGALAFDVTGENLSGPYDSAQAGWYLQAVYEFMQRWRAGLRYDYMDSGHPHIGLVSSGTLPATAFPALLPATPDRTTLMVDWSLSEFSRLRAQFAWDQARANDEHDRQLILQYIFSIGAHGAHKF
ncbi:MAG: TonB-dependent receptor [Proteobacteria bacterium]|nr:TonB-dependent receptor [Pseudomonadota bacterium]